MNDEIVMKKKTTNRKYVLWLLPSFTGILVFWLFPFFRLVLLSVTKNDYTMFVGLEHFISVLQNESFRLAATNTLKFMIICIPFLWGLSFVFAVLLSKSSLLNIWIKEGLLYPFVLPTTAVLLLYQVSFGEQGWVNLLLHRQENWLNGKYAILVLVQFICGKRLRWRRGNRRYSVYSETGKRSKGTHHRPGPSSGW